MKFTIKNIVEHSHAFQVFMVDHSAGNMSSINVSKEDMQTFGFKVGYIVNLLNNEVQQSCEEYNFLTIKQQMEEEQRKYYARLGIILPSGNTPYEQPKEGIDGAIAKKEHAIDIMKVTKGLCK